MNIMDEFTARQISLIRKLLDDLNQGSLDLNSFIQKLDGIYHALQDALWKEQLFPIILDLEQISASALDSKKALAPSDLAEVGRTLKKLEMLVSSVPPA
jgi:hypothetical protein